MNKLDNTFQERLIRLPEVLSITSVGKSTWWKMVAEKRAPQPVRVSKRITSWKLSEIMEFIDSFDSSKNKGGSHND